MCGRFTQTSGTAPVAERFAVVSARVEVEPRYNIAPTDPVAVVVTGKAGRVLERFRWGLVPSWARSLKDRPQPINAKAETLATSGMFKKLLPTRRCLVVADGFYEWAQKKPFRICLKGRGLFAFAGLWDEWLDLAKKDAPPVYSCTIVTVDSNALIAPVHDRMPAILRPEDEEKWLDRALRDPAQLQRLLAPFAPEAMEMYAVSPLVNDVKNQGAECIVAA